MGSDSGAVGREREIDGRGRQLNMAHTKQSMYVQ